MGEKMIAHSQARLAQSIHAKKTVKFDQARLS